VLCHVIEREDKAFFWHVLETIIGGGAVEG